MRVTIGARHHNEVIGSGSCNSSFVANETLLCSALRKTRACLEHHALAEPGQDMHVVAQCASGGQASPGAVSRVSSPDPYNV
jgi:hypothetical protein